MKIIYTAITARKFLLFCNIFLIALFCLLVLVDGDKEIVLLAGINIGANLILMCYNALYLNYEQMLEKIFTRHKQEFIEFMRAHGAMDIRDISCDAKNDEVQP